MGFFSQRSHFTLMVYSYVERGLRSLAIGIALVEVVILRVKRWKGGFFAGETGKCSVSTPFLLAACQNINASAVRF